MESDGTLRSQKNFHAIRWVKGDFPIARCEEETPGISEYLDFGFYKHVYYKENSGLGMTSIIRWLGVSHRVFGLMSNWILTQNGTVISRTTDKRLISIEKDI